jgi:hypothetical protein
MDKIQKLCLALFLVLCSIALYATEDGVPLCNTIFGMHLNAQHGECK